jgi:hypothetical protein
MGKGSNGAEGGQAGMMVRAAPTRGPNGVGVYLRVDAAPERTRCSGKG